MATLRQITYECEQCGSEIIVRKTRETVLAPIYCCGTEVADVSVEGKETRPKKKTVKKPAGKIVKKKVTGKRKAGTKKK